MSLRRLANDVKTSTTAVYSLFGGKPGLIGALYREALERFAAHLSTVPASDDPVEDIVRMGRAYRRAALADPHLYSIIFGGPIPEFRPSPEDARFHLNLIKPLVDTAQHGIDLGVFPSVGADRIAYSCWAIAHGMVSIELVCRSGVHDETLGKSSVVSGRESDYEQAIRTLTDGWRTQTASAPH